MVEPSLGATTSTSWPQAFIENLAPAGANTQLNQVILQAPGAAQDSFGQLHIRGDHGNIQFRLNNVILPEGLQVFGQTLSPRLASNIDLITGALPAQVRATHRRHHQHLDEKRLQGRGRGFDLRRQPRRDRAGGRNTAAPGAQQRLLGSLSYTGTDVGIESPDGRGTPIHDHSDQFQVFGYVDHIIDDHSRVSAIVGTSQQSFQIPNTPGLQPELGLTAGTARRTFRQRETAGPPARGDELRHRQLPIFDREVHRPGLGVRPAIRHSAIRPTSSAKLLFNGIGQAARKTDLSIGTPAGRRLCPERRPHDPRRGDRFARPDHPATRPPSCCRSTKTGAQTTDVPLTIVDNGARSASTFSAFLQDEWKLTGCPDPELRAALRLPAGLPHRTAAQPSREHGLAGDRHDNFHIGYARYFTPPPFELVGNETIAKFVNTTAAPPGTGNDLPRSERDHYFDVGVEQKLGAFTIGLDAYYKKAKNLIDEGQFGAPIILTPFNYAQGFAKGVEVSANYAKGPLTAYANLAVSQAKGRDIVSSQFNFDPADLAYIQTHFIYLDHDQTITPASAGAAYKTQGGGRVSADLIYGSGLRRDGEVPNGSGSPPICVGEPGRLAGAEGRRRR